jgi:hypothetical protein
VTALIALDLPAFERAGDPEAQRGTTDPDQHIGNQAHLRVRLHYDAREPTNNAADDH